MGGLGEGRRALLAVRKRVIDITSPPVRQDAADPRGDWRGDLRGDLCGERPFRVFPRVAGIHLHLGEYATAPGVLLGDASQSVRGHDARAAVGA
ncbi:hypothetical protein [Streptomyces sp. WMMC897]|uniref:hypothetical protein n=1 Tax=Streptomyces sp. WMMC897 TaxID=3014782 RepID=UPI0022B67FFC|nr:hypothetical protein [Streptomyces sp. WMMC897]MCZ7413331.1 hypothetical protein [Streptomyces sp. WMMC897]